MDIAVSVIVPVYNCEKYIKDCIKSVLNQTLTNIEIVCINDGSTDNSLLLLEDLAIEDERIVVINKTNTGASDSRNIGIRNAKGRFVFFLDSDDWLPDENVLWDLYQAASVNNVLIAGGSFSEWFDDGHVVDEWSGVDSQLRFYDDGLVEFQDYQYDFGWVRFIYDREMIIRNELFLPTLSYFEDPVWFVKVMVVAKRFYSLKRISYCYRRGHKDFIMSLPMVQDLLTGMIEIVRTGKEFNLTSLSDLEIRRLISNYSYDIAKYLELGDQIIKRQLLDLNNELNLPKDIETMIYEKCLEDIKLELDTAKRELDIAKSRLEDREKTVAYLQNERKRDHESWNWKVGSALLWLPKRIFYHIKGCNSRE